MIFAVILAGGSSLRMGDDKLFIKLGEYTVFERSCLAYTEHAQVDGVVIAASKRNFEEIRKAVARLNIKKPVILCVGGLTRGESALCALNSLPEECDMALIHDAARPFVSAEVIDSAIAMCREKGCGVAAVPCKDTIKLMDEDGQVLSDLRRDRLRCMQTPQAFRTTEILEAYRSAQKKHYEGTDDAAVFAWNGGKVYLSRGDEENIKLTTQADRTAMRVVCERRGWLRHSPRIGIGSDAHRLVETRRLVLGGEEIAFDRGLDGHSDADVLTHAVMDAILGAAALGDIGCIFPDSSDEFLGISSMELLRRVNVLVRHKGLYVSNIDAVITAQRPKLAPYTERMRANIALCLGIGAEMVSIKATTTEHMGFEGREEGISAQCVVLLDSI